MRLLLLALPLLHAADEPLVVAVYDVGFLHAYVPRRGAPPLDPVPAAGEGEEGVAFFGGMAEEAMQLGPTMSIEELIEYVRSNTDAGFWEREGASIQAQSPYLIVRTTAAGQAQVRQVLEILGRAKSRLVKVEAWMAAGGAPAGASDPDSLLAERVAAGQILAYGAATAFEGQRAPVALLRNRAYLMDYDVEVAEGARGLDPVVGVAVDGWVVGVEPMALGLTGRDRLDFHCSAVEGAASLEAHESATGGLPLALPDTRHVTFSGTATAESGKVVLAGVRGDRVLLLRCSRVEPPAVAFAEAREVGGRVERPAGEPKRFLRIYDVSALSEPVPEPRVPAHRLVGGLVHSDFQPPEEGDAREPRAIVDIDVVVELLRECVAPDTWEHQRVSILPAGGRLFIVQEAWVHEIIARTLDDLLRRMAAPVTLRAEWIALTPAAAASLIDGKSPFLDAAGIDALRAAGTAVAGGRATGFPARTLAISELRSRSYVSDWDVEIAADKNDEKIDPAMGVGHDPVVGEVHTGWLLTATVLRAGDGALFVDYDATMASLSEPMRALAAIEGAGFGAMEFPETHVVRFGGSILLPQGGGAITAAARHPDGTLLCLLLSAPLA